MLTFAFSEKKDPHNAAICVEMSLGQQRMLAELERVVADWGKRGMPQSQAIDSLALLTAIITVAAPSRWQRLKQRLQALGSFCKFSVPAARAYCNYARLSDDERNKRDAHMNNDGPEVAEAAASSAPRSQPPGRRLH